MNEQEIDHLVLRVKRNDHPAFDELVHAIRKDLRIFLSAHASSVDMVEEVLQATLVACYENIGKYEPRGTFLSWAKGIGRNLLMRELEARRRYVNAEDLTLERMIVESSLAAAAPGSEERADATAERLRNCLDKLPDVSRALIEKRYYRKTALRALAKALDRTETWTAVTLFRIREALRQCMETEAAK